MPIPDATIKQRTARPPARYSVLSFGPEAREPVAVHRRQFITLIGGAATWPLAARAQQPKTQRRIAIFHPAIPVALLTETGGGSAWRAFFGELRRLGYIEGENLIIERYSAEGHHERYTETRAGDREPQAGRDRHRNQSSRDRLKSGNQHDTGCRIYARSIARGAGHQSQPARRQSYRLLQQNRHKADLARPASVCPLSG